MIESEPDGHSSDDGAYLESELLVDSVEGTIARG